MKKLLALCLLTIAAAFTAPARADTPPFTVGAEYPWRFQCDLSSASPTALPLTIFYRQDVSNGTTTIQNPTGQLSIDLAAMSSKTVTIGGQTLTYGQIFAELSAVFAAERAAQLAGGGGH